MCIYPVQAAEWDVNRERKEVLDHFLKSLNKFLLVPLDLLRFKAQKDSHSDAEHEALHFRVHEHGRVALQPVSDGAAHLLLDHRDVVLQSIPRESLEDRLQHKRTRSQTRFKLKRVKLSRSQGCQVGQNKHLKSALVYKQVDISLITLTLHEL